MISRKDNNITKRYLKSFRLNEVYQKIKPFYFEFKSGLNVIVGENGSGKSTLLHLLQVHEKNNKITTVDVTPVEYRFFDTEKQNPRISTDIYSFKDIRTGIALRFVSHGEAMLALLKSTQTFNDLLIMVDEPEAGLSLQNQKKILELFNKATENNCQIIAITHSYVFIKSAKEVFSMDEKKWISSENYLEDKI
jgi:predicted ATPase